MLNLVITEMTKRKHEGLSHWLLWTVKKDLNWVCLPITAVCSNRNLHERNSPCPVTCYISQEIMSDGVPENYFPHSGVVLYFSTLIWTHLLVRFWMCIHIHISKLYIYMCIVSDFWSIFYDWCVTLQWVKLLMAIILKWAIVLKIKFAN